MLYRRTLAAVSITTLSLFAAAVPSFAAEENAAAAARIKKSLSYLASDELGGRGVGTDGIDLAADFIASRFAELGLKTDLFDGGPFQKFDISIEAAMGPKDQNRLTLIGPAGNDGKPTRIELKLEEQFNPLAIGGADSFEGPLVFAGYGISSKEASYDEYADLDVKGKVVVLIRREPQQADRKSRFNGVRPSQHAYFKTKVQNAAKRGAKAVIIVNDNFTLKQQGDMQQKLWRDTVDKLVELRQEFTSKAKPSDDERKKHRAEVLKLSKRIQEISDKLEQDYDQLVQFNQAGGNVAKNMPVFFCRRASIEPVLAAGFGDESLESIESSIDEKLVARSKPLKGWSANGEASILRQKAIVKNVVAVLPGAGPLADEVVIVGAHYDHLGMGGAGSLAPWTKEIHNGADDNASGTAGLLEVARQLTSNGKAPRRTIVFMAFTAEERGLLGSEHYVRNPRFPLSKTVAMVNMDMIGRLEDRKLIVSGTGTATEFDKLIDGMNERYKFRIDKKPSGFGPSDHASFYKKKIPVFHIFTGLHNNYHRPSDDIATVDFPGMSRITAMVTDIVAEIANADARPTYRDTKTPARGTTTGSRRPFFGSISDLTFEGQGYSLMDVVEGGPAAKAGLQAGDVVVRLGASEIKSLTDLQNSLEKRKPGDKVAVIFLRDGKEMKTVVELGKPR